MSFGVRPLGFARVKQRRALRAVRTVFQRLAGSLGLVGTLAPSLFELWRTSGFAHRATLMLRSTLALPDQDQADRRERRAVSGPLDLVDHEARLRPGDRAGALADPQKPDSKREEANDQKQSAHGLASLAGPAVG